MLTKHTFIEFMQTEIFYVYAYWFFVCAVEFQGHKKLVIDGVTKYFTEQDAKHKDHDPNEFRFVWCFFSDECMTWLIKCHVLYTACMFYLSTLFMIIVTGLIKI